MADIKRDPHSDADIIDNIPPTPSQSGTSGGELQREIGSADDEKVATGADPQPTSVHKSQKPEGGDEPSLPNRNPAGGKQAKVPPRRTR